MKRLLILLLAVILCFTGCKKKPVDIPGGEVAPEGVDWRNWEQYASHTLTMGEETVDVLIGLDAIHFAVYYDRDEQELLGAITILTPLTDVEYSKVRLKIQDFNGDGYDDIAIPDMLPGGDRLIDCWVWDAGEKTYLYAPEYSQLQEDVGADISWRNGKHLISGMQDSPEGGKDLLIWVTTDTIYVYADQREENLLTQMQIPAPLSQEAMAEISVHSFWDLRDMNADGWGDLQLTYRWEETENGVCAYAYCWLWQPDSGTFRLDAARSEVPVM